MGTAIAGLISIALLVWVAAPGKVLNEIAHMSAIWAIVALALEVGSCLSYVIVFRYFFPEAPGAASRRVAWIAMAAGALLPGGNVSSAAATGLLLRRHGLETRRLLERCAALLCLLTAFGFAVNGAAGALLLAGVPDGPLDLSHAGIPIVVSVVVLSAAAMVVFISRRLGLRAPLAVRGVAAGLEGAWAAVRNPSWRLVGAAGFLCLDMAALWAACAATGHRLGFLAVLIAYCIGYLATVVPMPAGLGVLDTGLAGALVLYGLPGTASVGAVLVYHAISIWVPSVGGLAAWVSMRGARKIKRGDVSPARIGRLRLAEAAEADG
ncbi:MAG: lysylphosphatidylglycerol synthase domain-containing protein [Solirubrobacteraceae bacterium]